MKTLLRTAFFALFLFGTSSAIQAQDLNRTFQASPDGKLVLDLETGGDIVIRGWNRNEASFSVNITGRDADQVTVEFDESARTIEVFSEYKSRRARADVNMEINVPARFNLDLSTTGGDLNISGITGRIEGSSMGGDLVLSQLGGRLDLSTMGGDIELTNSEVDGSLHTMGGDVTITDVTGNINGTTMGGDIDVQELNGWIEANTMGGDVVVNMVGGTEGDRHIELSSMGGTIEVTVPRGLEMDIEIEIRLGDNDEEKYEIISDFDLNVEVEKNDDRRWRSSREVVATGRTGSGKNRIKITTVNGDVILREGR